MATTHGVELSAWVVPNSKASTRLIVSHGNGLAARGYRAFWQPLCQQYEVVALDLRGHGRSDPGPAEEHDWAHMHSDLEQVMASLAAELGPRYTVGALHSLAAVLALMQLQAGSQAWDALVLYDLSCAPPSNHALAAVHGAEMKLRAQRAHFRRACFDSPAQLAEHFSRVDRVGRWQGRAPLDMAEATLRPSASTADGWELSCAPEREAAIYLGNLDMGLWDVLASPRCPVLLVGGDAELPGADAPSRCCRAAHQATRVAYAFIPGTGHFLQLESPERCGRILNDFVDSTRTASSAAVPLNEKRRQA